MFHLAPDEVSVYGCRYRVPGDTDDCPYCGSRPGAYTAIACLGEGCPVCADRDADLDALTARLTAFRTFSDLLHAAGGYHPSVCPDTDDHRRLRAAYNGAQAKLGDPRRCYPA